MAVPPPAWLLLLGGAIIVLAFAVNYRFRRAGAPDIIFLLLLGVLLGPILGLLDRGVLLQASPLVTAVALVVILLEGGLTMNPGEVSRGGPRGVLLAVVAVLFAAAASALAGVLLFSWDPMVGFLFGLAVAPTGTIVVIALSRQLPIREDASAAIVFETSINDVLAILMVFAVLDSLVVGGPSVGSFLQTLFGQFSLGAALGVMGGVAAWLALERVRGQPYSYMLTLATAFIIYSASEITGGSGPVGVLAFGLVLGNPAGVLRRLGRAPAPVLSSPSEATAAKHAGPGELEPAIRAYHSEATFLVRSFFFVFVGALAAVSSPWVLAYGAVLTLVLLASRYLAVLLCTAGSPLRESRALMTILMPKGLSTAVVATILLSFGSRHPDIISPQVATMMSDMVFAIIILSFILAIAGANLLTRGMDAPPSAAKGLPPVPQKMVPGIGADERRRMLEAALGGWRAHTREKPPPPGEEGR
ncbi:MAG: cation:proton antiporter [Euryarchaeota archaeon]|nr:cation:proton antiporter [Euryarchaeota archaeon]